MLVKGRRGKLTAAGRWIAELGKWELGEPNDDQRLCHAVVAKGEEFLLKHTTHSDVWLWTGKKWWYWKRMALAVRGQSVTVTLQGRPQTRYG